MVTVDLYRTQFQVRRDARHIDTVWLTILLFKATWSFSTFIPSDRHMVLFWTMYLGKGMRQGYVEQFMDTWLVPRCHLAEKEGSRPAHFRSASFPTFLWMSHSIDLADSASAKRRPLSRTTITRLYNLQVSRWSSKKQKPPNFTCYKFTRYPGKSDIALLIQGPINRVKF